ncbi:MAG TPA: hypothetical protein PLV07_11870 [Acidiphilium sp.]|uniref:NUDIX hydrolase n=1 Tax=unclassified Acidiphilium TaxID=2617493 RepID=UPI000BD7F2DB|nr:MULTISPECIES: hypothetical protein [unclassified Acidiphilium]OYV55267.1 MAG: hypothetical protein B7Z76_11255 [Acidiphilium sp. 20-67-58]HQT61740.1 hypothetical protein [Acidiphilium sp.]HQU12270.1 hypothetical protein [Acidiphilium sp.]
MSDSADPIHAELIAVVVAVTDATPRVLTLLDGSALPAGPLESAHRSLQAGLRDRVERQTGHPLGHVEQLYTFADAGRSRAGRSISISYLALSSETRARLGGQVSWQDWYRYFPWEDRRTANDAASRIEPGLRSWVGTEPTRRARIARCFGLDGTPWQEDLALDRYELLYEAGLVREAARDGRPAHGEFAPGATLAADHRRILATAISRLRARLRARPAVFELMPERFSLLELQHCIESVSGQKLHKQNFRRLIEGQNLLEETGDFANGPGRPAKLFRFRSAIRDERAMTGSRPPLATP